jgi:hypothetical protein
MSKKIKITKAWGRLIIEQNAEKSYLLMMPVGLINPSFIKMVLKHGHEFGITRPNGWRYIVDTSAFLIPNPLNLLYLRKVQSLPNISSYTVYAPSFVVRILERLVSKIMKTDQIIDNEDEFKAFLEG